MASSPTGSETTDPLVNVTSLLSTGNKLTKEYSVSDGNLRKEYPGTIYQGYAHRDCVPLSKIVEGIAKATSHHALCPGVCDRDEVCITFVGRDNPDDGLYARSKRYFQFEDGLPALVIFDYDPDDRGKLMSSPDQLLQVIGVIHPDLKPAAHVEKPSASAGIRYADTGELIAPVQGFHIYAAALDGSDIPRYMDTLFKQLVIAGFGFIKISKSGSLLVRTIIDGAIKSPERIDYVAPAIVGAGLTRDHVDAIFVPGGYLDTHSLPSLTEQQEEQYQSIVGHLKQQAAGDAEKIRQQYVEKKAAESGQTVQQVREALEQADKGYLAHTQALILNDGSTVLVEDIFSNPVQWNHRSMRDPFDPEKGPDKAMLFCNKDGSIVLHSFVGGERTYRLQNRPVSIYSNTSYHALHDAQLMLRDACDEIYQKIDAVDEVAIV